MNRKLVAITIAAPLIVGLAMLLYTWPSARSQPRDVPVGLVAAPALVNSLAGQLQNAGGLVVHRYSSVAQVRAAVRHRQVDAAVIRSAAGSQVLIASAAGPALAMALKPTLTGVAGHGAVVDDVVPTPSTDPKGSVLGEAVLPLTLAGQLSAIMLTLAVRPGARQLIPLVLISAAAGLIGDLIIDTWLDVLGPATWWIAAGAIGLTVLAIGCIVLGLHALLDKAGLPVAFGLLVFLGNAFSGATSAPGLLPPAARRIGQWLPPGAGNELLRSVAFFHGHGATHPIVVLGVWIVLGFGAVAGGHVLTERQARRGRHESDGARPAGQPAT